MNIDAKNKSYTEINAAIADSDDVLVSGCNGQRFIGAGTGGKKIEILGIPGNALGAYLNGSEITVKGNAQDAVGDTMNDGKIVVYGGVGDAVGYAMRGGSVYVKGNAGYRAGIHMKEYRDKKPVIVIGGTAGSFLGEYQAGGIIIVLGIGVKGEIVGDFCGTGMHGGKMLLRTNVPPKDLPEQVKCVKATVDDVKEISGYVKEFCRLFGQDEKEITDSDFYLLTPNSASPYKRLYVMN